MEIFTTYNLTLEVSDITKENALIRAAELSDVIGLDTAGTWSLVDDMDYEAASGGVHNWASLFEQIDSTPNPALIVAMNNLAEDVYQDIIGRIEDK